MRMEIQDYVDSIKLQLFAGVLESELDDQAIEKLVRLSLEEMNRYYNSTTVITVPASNCIDLSPYPQISTILHVFRASSISANQVQPAYETNTTNYGTVTYATPVDNRGMTDPFFVSQLQMYNFGSTYYSNDWINRYTNYALTQRIANTFSTDLNFREDKPAKKLYINFSQGMPKYVSIEYIPRLMDVSEVNGEFWEDILMRLSLAHVKIALGRIRTRFTQDSAVWHGDGETILSVGNTELSELRDRLRDYVNNTYTPMD